MSTSYSTPEWESLTARERELLKFLARGSNNKAIAASLSISLKTVEFHLTNILKKLEMNSRAEVIVWIFENNFDTLKVRKD